MSLFFRNHKVTVTLSFILSLVLLFECNSVKVNAEYERTSIIAPPTETEHTAQNEVVEIPIYSKAEYTVAEEENLDCGLNITAVGSLAYFSVYDLDAMYEEINNISYADGIVKFNMSGETVSVFADDRHIECCGRCFMGNSLIIDCDDIKMSLDDFCRLFSVTYEISGATASIIGEFQLPAYSYDFYDDDEVYWLAKIINAESRGEILDGKIAVGNVVLNRKNSDGFPSTVYGVIFDREYGVQFSPTEDGSIYLEPSADCITAAKICLEGYSLSEDILFFVNSSTAKDTWVETHRCFALKIGNHDFYY